MVIYHAKIRKLSGRFDTILFNRYNLHRFACWAVGKNDKSLPIMMVVNIIVMNPMGYMGLYPRKKNAN